MKLLNKDGRLHVVPARVKNKYIIRFTVTSLDTTRDDIVRDWKIIQEMSDQVLIKLKQDEIKREEIKKFQSSLLLSNVPQTPKLVNASFLAFFPDTDMTYEIAKELTNRDYSRAHLPLTPRRKPKLNNNNYQKGLSFDQLALFSNLPVQQKNGNLPVLIVPNLDNKNEQNGYKPVQIIQDQNNNKKNMSQKFYNKQASLDSKIEHIFEEAEEAESQPNIDSNSLSFN